MKINSLIGVCIIGTTVFVGCGAKKDERPSMAMQECERIVRKEEFSSSAKAIAKQTLVEWQNNVLDPVPVLMDAQYTHTKTGELYLDMYMSDEDFDVKGIIISEIHKNPGKPDIAFEEKYPVFVDYSAGLPEQLRVYIRTFPELRKSEEKWVSYMQKGSYIEGYPPIKISIPSPYITVSLSIYDEQGHVSNSVLLIRSPDSYPLPPEFRENYTEIKDENAVNLYQNNSANGYTLACGTTVLYDASQKRNVSKDRYGYSYPCDHENRLTQIRKTNNCLGVDNIS